MDLLQQQRREEQILSLFGSIEDRELHRSDLGEPAGPDQSASPWETAELRPPDAAPGWSHRRPCFDDKYCHRDGCAPSCGCHAVAREEEAWVTAKTCYCAERAVKRADDGSIISEKAG